MKTSNKKFLPLCLLCLSSGLLRVADAQTPPAPAAHAKLDPLAILNILSGIAPYSGPFREPVSPAETQAAQARAETIMQYERRGETLMKSGDNAGAITAFQQALALEPYDGLAEQRLAEAYTASGQPGQALATYRRLIYHVPGQRSGTSNESSPTVLMHFALLLLQTGQEAEALSVYHRGIYFLDYDMGKPNLGTPVPFPGLGDGPGQVPYSPQTLQAMAHLTLGFDSNGLDTWVTESEAAARLAPDMAVVQFYLGRSLLAVGHNPEARAALEKAIQLGDAQTAREANVYLKMAR